MNGPITPTYRNALLSSLPADALARISPHLVAVDLPRNRTLRNPGVVEEYVYFLEGGMCSIVATMKNGMTIEVGVIGKEGFVDVPTLLSAGESPTRSFMQIAGHGFMVKAKILTEESEHPGPLRTCLLRFAQGLLVQTAQTAACNRIHEATERLARWLLMCADRMEGEHIGITHELLATMLGTDRSTVSLAANHFQKLGVISYRRGDVEIRDRPALEAAACECYQTVHDEYVRLGLFKPS